MRRDANQTLNYLAYKLHSLHSEHEPLFQYPRLNYFAANAKGNVELFYYEVQSPNVQKFERLFHEMIWFIAVQIFAMSIDRR